MHVLMYALPMEGTLRYRFKYEHCLRKRKSRAGAGEG